MIRELICKIFNHQWKFLGLYNICDCWWAGTVRDEQCSRCGKRRELSFSSSKPLTKIETERIKPSLIDYK